MATSRVEQELRHRRIAARSARTRPRPRRGQIDRAELEDRQVHRDDEAADHDAEEHDDDRLEQARQRRHGVVDLALVEVGDLAQHAVERARLLADLRHLQHHRSGTAWCCVIALVRLVPVLTSVWIRLVAAA